MFSLVIKDILIQKKSLPMVLLISIIMLLAFKGLSSGGGYIMSTIYFVFILIAGVFGYDEKYKSDTLINSLPTSRKNVVLARYLSLLIFIIAAILFVSLLGIVIKLIGIPLDLNIMNLADICIIISLCSIIFSIYIPIYFKFGYVKSRFANLVLYIAAFAFSGVAMGIRQAMIEDSNEPYMKVLLGLIHSIPSWLLYILPVILLAVIVSLSIKISIKAYTKKEF